MGHTQYCGVNAAGINHPTRKPYRIVPRTKSTWAPLNSFSPDPLRSTLEYYRVLESNECNQAQNRIVQKVQPRGREEGGWWPTFAAGWDVSAPPEDCGGEGDTPALLVLTHSTRGSYRNVSSTDMRAPLRLRRTVSVISHTFRNAPSYPHTPRASTMF